MPAVKLRSYKLQVYRCGSLFVFYKRTNLEDVYKRQTGVVVSKLIEFQFSSIASQRIQDPEKLTAFFGFWFSTANVISLGVQLLVTQRVLAALGVGRSLFVSPAVLFAGAAAVLYTCLLYTSRCV